MRIVSIEDGVASYDARTLGWLVAVAAWLVIAPQGVLAEDQFPDDHGDDAANATSIAVGGPALGGTSEMEVDRDVFSFTAEAGKEYTVTVVEGTVPDVAVRLHTQTVTGPSVTSGYSVGASEVVLQWANTFGQSEVTLEVTAFAMFTNGTYTVQVEEAPPVDSDGDDLPDVWENYYFGDLDEGKDDDYDLDGLSNHGEYLLGSNPTISVPWDLRITSLVNDGGSRMITFSTVPLQTYEVQAVTTSPEGSWTPLGVVIGETSFATFEDENPSEHCLYRVVALP